MEFHGFPVRLVEAGVDWGVVASWAQFGGSMIALVVAIGVPWWQERSRLQQAKRDLIERRQAAYIAMEKVIETIAAKQLFWAGEIEGIAAVLDRLDANVMTPVGMRAFASLRGRVAVAAALVQANSGRNANQMVGADFNAGEAKRELEACLGSMWVE